MIELLEKIANKSLNINLSYYHHKTRIGNICTFVCLSFWIIVSLCIDKYVSNDMGFLPTIAFFTIIGLFFYGIYKLMARSMLLISNDVLTNDDFTGYLAEYKLFEPKIEFTDHEWIISGRIVIGNISKNIQFSFDNLERISFIDGYHSIIIRQSTAPVASQLCIRDFIGTTTTALFESDLFIHLVSCGITATDLISKEFLQRKCSLIIQLTDSTSQDTKLMEFLKNLDALNRVDNGIYDFRFVSKIDAKTQKHIFGFISVKNTNHKLDLYLKDHFLILIDDFNIYRASIGWTTLTGSDLIILSISSDFEFEDGSIYFFEPNKKP